MIRLIEGRSQVNEFRVRRGHRRLLYRHHPGAVVGLFTRGWGREGRLVYQENDHIRCQGLNCTQELFFGKEMVSLLYREVSSFLREGFHCIYTSQDHLPTQQRDEEKHSNVDKQGRVTDQSVSSQEKQHMIGGAIYITYIIADTVHQYNIVIKTLSL